MYFFVNQKIRRRDIVTVSVKAYAKINLFLDIVSLREDNYHNILSLMQSVSLHDTIKLDYSESENKKIEIFCDDTNIPCNEKNLAYKAADLILEDGHLRITITKRIPSEAGLGGGSADAAATLIGLNKILGDKYSTEELKALGAKLGADVPFCIEGGACIVEGIGEKTAKCPPMPQYPIVIALRGEGMSTPLAYKKLDERFGGFKSYSANQEKLDVLVNGSDISIEQYCNCLFNIFETVVEPERPDVTYIKQIFSDCNATGAMMSGSGTSVFGIFKNEADALIAVEKNKSCGTIAHICYPCDNSDAIIKE